MSSQLKEKTISGLLWSFLQNVGSRGVKFVVTLLLARMLVPEDFGLIGMLTIFINLSQTLVTGGLSQALIQKKEVDDLDYSTVFYINIVASLFIYTVLFFSAPLISLFYGQPILTELTKVLSLVFVIDSLSYVQRARLQKTMQFKYLTITELPSYIIAGIISIVMANFGYGVWSIVALELAQRLIFGIQIWFIVDWKPTFSFSYEKAKALFSFGGNLMFARILNTVYRNIYLVVIGKFFTLNTVGYYQHSRNIVQKTTQTFSTVVRNVTFPAFSTIQDEDEKLKTGYSKVIQQMVFFLSPFYMLVAILAEPLFLLVFTEKWVEAVPYFQILCVTGVLFPLNSFNLNIVNVKGRSDIYLKLSIVKKVITTIGLFIAIPLGIWALLTLRVLDGIIAYILNSHFAGKFINYKLVDQLKDIFPSILLSCTVGIVVLFFDATITDQSNILRIIWNTLVGGITFLILTVTFKPVPYQDFRLILKEYYGT